MLTLKKLRQQIDKTDRKILEVLAKRFAITQKVGQYKKKHQLRAKDPKREKEIFRQREKWAKELGFEPTFIKNFLI